MIDLDALEQAARAAMEKRPFRPLYWMPDGGIGTFYNTAHPSAVLALIERVRRAEAALIRALPSLEENYRWHRGAQSHAGTTLSAHTALTEARAALEARDDG